MIVCFDGDVAGRALARQALAELETAGVRGRAIVLPEGDDPDAFVARHGIDAFARLLDRTAA